jgi:hypothetical protein
MAILILSAPTAFRASAQGFVDLFMTTCPEQGGTSFPGTLTVPQGTRNLKLQVELYAGADYANTAALEFPDYQCVVRPLSYSNPSFSVHVRDASAETLFQETFPALPSFFLIRTCTADPDWPPPREKVEVRTIDIGDLAADADAVVTVESHFCVDEPMLTSRSSWMEGRLSADNTPLLGVFSNEAGLGEQRGDLYPAPQPPLLSTLTAAPAVQAGPEPTPGQTIRVALGQPFGWGMTRKVTNEQIECTFALDYVVFDPDNPIVDDSAVYPGRTVSLFKDQVLLPFGFDKPQTRVTMVGVHLGTQYFRATPTDGKTRAAIVKVEVKPPQVLGNSPNDLDDEIVEVANRRGILPQWIKGNAYKESGKKRAGAQGTVFWDRETWRYEPLSWDLAHVSRGQQLRTQDPYERYRMATQTNDPPPIGLAQGTSVTQNDIDYRSVLSIRRGGVRRPIDPTDPDVTAREILDGNLGQNWQTANSRRWQRAEAQRRAGNDPMTFNAQTPIATSYGLLQIMFPVAIDDIGWHDAFNDPNAVVNPSLLMDTSQNLAVGEGSLHVSTVYHLYVYTRASAGGYKGQPAFRIDQFDNFAAFEESWRKGIRFYNKDMPGYADDVLKYAKTYSPSRTDAGIQ